MEKSVELLKGKKGKKWILWSVIVAVAIVAVIIAVVLMTGGSKNPLKGCEFVYPISNLEEYKIVFDEETVTLHHNYYRKNSQSVSGKVKDSKKSNARTIEIPQEELEEKLEKGLTQQQIADYYKCSVDTVQRRMDEYGLRKNRKPQAPQGTANIPQKGRTQFNVNVNDNENENGNV